jgi:hypothetical protein
MTLTLQKTTYVGCKYVQQERFSTVTEVEAGVGVVVTAGRDTEISGGAETATKSPQVAVIIAATKIVAAIKAAIQNTAATKTAIAGKERKRVEAKK